MAIRIAPKGYGESITGLAKLAGESERTIREQKRREAVTSEVRQLMQGKFQAEEELKYRKELAELNHFWDIEAFNRSKSWQIEKMEMASKADFLRQEQERQRQLNEFDAKKKAISESNILTDEEKQMWLMQFETGLPIATMALKPTNLKPPKTGAPLTVDTMALDVDKMVNAIEDVGSRWRKGPIWTKKEEAIDTIAKRMPEFGWQGRNITQKIQLFTTLDRKLKENKKIEWGENESKSLAEMLGLLSPKQKVSGKNEENQIKSLPKEFQDIWEKAKKEGVTPSEFLEEMYK